MIAMVGGRQASFEGFNRALDAKRSIGSLVKPVIYLAAIESGQFNAASIIEDAPVEVKLAEWQDVEAAEHLRGVLRPGAAGACAGAIDESRDRAIWAWKSGLPKVTREFVALGLEHEPPQLPSVLLGSLDVSPLEVAQLYNAFANGGFSTPLRAVRAVVDAEGKPLKSFALEVTPVADPEGRVSGQSHDGAGDGARHRSRGARAYLPSELVVAGKSGTSSDYRDSWFAGFSGSHLAVVWIGYDDNTPTGLTGSSGSLRGVVAPDGAHRHDFMERAVAGRPARKRGSNSRRAWPRSRAAAKSRSWSPCPSGTQLPVQAGLRDAASSASSASGPSEWWRGIDSLAKRWRRCGCEWRW